MVLKCHFWHKVGSMYWIGLLIYGENTQCVLWKDKLRLDKFLMWKRKVSYVERWDFYARRCDMFLWKQEVVFLDHGVVMKKRFSHGNGLYLCGKTRFLYENMKFMRFFLLKHDVTQDIWKVVFTRCFSNNPFIKKLVKK